jgi:hypothetical protein
VDGHVAVDVLVPTAYVEGFDGLVQRAGATLGTTS